MPRRQPAATLLKRARSFLGRPTFRWFVAGYQGRTNAWGMHREGAIPKLADLRCTHAACALPRHPLQKRTVVQWDTGACSGADDGADKSRFRRLVIALSKRGAYREYRALYTSFAGNIGKEQDA